MRELIFKMNGKLDKSILFKLNIIGVISCIIFITSLGFGQGNIGDSIKSLSPQGIFDKIYDEFGNVYRLENLKVKPQHKNFSPPPPSTQITPQTEVSYPTCQSGYFNLYFEDGSGFEIETDSYHMQRRDVLCQMFSDLSNFINSPLLSTGKKVNILIRNIQPINSNPNLTGTASAFYVAPDNSNINLSGIIDNEIWKTINSGVDSYEGVFTPVNVLNEPTIGNNFYHGWMAFNFTPQFFQWHYDMTMLAPNGNMDLYTIALHEITHALGITSLIYQDGTSRLGVDLPYYSRYDMSLKTNDLLQNLITNSGSCSMYNYSFNTSLIPASNILSPSCQGGFDMDNTNCSSAIKYSNSIDIPVFTPDCFMEGSSLSHFEDQCHPIVAPSNNNMYFAMSNSNNLLTTQNNTKRFYQEEERIVLCDLGYNVNVSFGDITGSVVFNNYKAYNQACSHEVVVGVNDGLNPDLTYTYTNETSYPVQISNFLANDYFSDGSSVRYFECLEEVTLPSTLSSISVSSGTNSTVISFTGEGGLHVLRYIPVSSTGIRGNITYIYLYIFELGVCDLQNTCGFINNGGFEDATVCGIIPNYGVYPLGISCWDNFVGSPDFFNRNCTNPMFQTGNNLWLSQAPTNSYNGSGNDNFMGLVAAHHPTNPSYEGVFNYMSNTLIPGQEYTIKFWAKVIPDYVHFNTEIYPYTYDATIPSFINFVSLPNYPSIVPIESNIYSENLYPQAIRLVPELQLISDNLWHEYEETFVFTVPIGYNFPTTHNKLIVHSGYTTPSTGSFETYFVFDDISIIPTNQNITFDLPEQICNGQILNNLNDYLSNSFQNGVFSGDGVVYNGTNFSFEPNLIQNSIVTLYYTYTGVNGCEYILSDEITVGSPFTLSQTQICQNESVVLNLFGAGNYVINPGNILSNGEAVTLTPLTTTTYTISYNGFCGAITSQFVITVNPLPDVFFTLTPNQTNFCGSTTIYFHANENLTYEWIRSGAASNLAADFQPNSISQDVFANISQSTFYTLHSTNEFGCSDDYRQLITVSNSSAANISISGNATQYCLGETATFTSTITNGGTTPTYQWKVNNVDAVGETNATFSSNTLQNGDVVTCVLTSSNTCVATPTTTSNAITFTISNGPTLTITATDNELCFNESTTLTASGADSYVWDTGETTATITVTPSTTGSFSVIGTQIGGCSNTESISITVNELPVITFSPENPTTCAGNPSTILAIGSSPGTNFTWDGFLSGANPMTDSPASSTTYNVTATDLNGCVNTAAVLLTVNPLPELFISANPSIICQGESTTISVTGNSSSYVWDNGYGNVNTVTVTPNATTTYVVTGFLGACAAEAFVEVEVQNCACSQNTANIVLNSDINSPTNFSNQVIFVEQSFTISDDVIFKNCEIKVASGAQITVRNMKTRFEGCHIYSCSDQMWEGIFLTEKGKLEFLPIFTGNTLTKTCLVEDARKAVLVAGITDLNPAVFILKTNQTTFNKNHVDIEINDIQPNPSVEPSVFFDISDNVFTCRNLPFTPADHTNYLNTAIWPYTFEVNDPSGTTDPLSPPNIPSMYDMNTNATLKIPFAGLKTYQGIVLNNVGVLVGTFPNYTHTKIIIGTGHPRFPNIFDNMHFGIYANNSNVECRANVFQNIFEFGKADPEAAIFAWSNIGDPLTNRRNALHIVANAAGATLNRFYNCTNAVHARSVWDVKIDNIWVRNNYSTNLPRNGVIINTAFFKQLTITKSEFYNTHNAIMINHINTNGSITYPFWNMTMTTNQVNGSILISKNKFHDNWGNTNVTSRELRNAILVNNISNSSGTNLASSSIRILDNKMTDVFRGIDVKNWISKPILIQSNEAKLVPENSVFAQYGIGTMNNTGNGLSINVIDNNIIDGFDADNDDKQIAIYSSMSRNQRVTCNYVSNSFHGIKFDGNNSGTRFEKNVMDNHTYGYVLDQTGIIGTQGFISSTSSNYRTDNEWREQIGTWTGTHFKTATLLGSTAITSKMYVRSSPATFSPEGISFSGSGNEYYLSGTTGTILTSTAHNTTTLCNTDHGNPNGGTGAGTGTGVLSGGSTSLLLLEQIALNELEYTHNPEQTQVINEHKLFKMLEREPDLRTQSAILESFYQSNLITNKKKVSETENYIAVGELSSASSEVSTIIDDNEVDFTYKLYYEWYLNQTWDSLPSNSDSTFLVDLANSCPFTKGEVVYQARALFQSIYNYSEAFVDDCENKRGGSNLGKDGVSDKEEIGMEENKQFGIYPNPNNGEFFITISKENNDKQQFEIYDNSGKLIFQDQLLFENGSIKLIRNLVNGIYLFKLTNKENNEQLFKRVTIINH